MTVLIQISYNSSGNSILRRGSFPLKGKSKEEVAYDFWKWIKSEHPFDCEIEKIICNGDEITEEVKHLVEIH